MKVLVDIPDEEYKKIINHDDFHTNRDNIVSYVRSGICIPGIKGTLLIISKEALKNQKVNFSFSVEDWYSEVAISNATLKVLK